MNSCENCNEPINGNYCSNCGQPTVPKRIDKYYFFQIEVNDHTFVSPFLDIRVEGIDGVESVFRWMKENFGYSNLLIGLFMAFWIKIFFRKFGYNFFEVFILLCFVSGISTLILSVGTILHSITHLNLIKIASFITMLYSVWEVGQFFDKKKLQVIRKHCSLISWEELHLRH
jgi:hypothetical protein